MYIILSENTIFDISNQCLILAKLLYEKILVAVNPYYSICHLIPLKNTLEEIINKLEMLVNEQNPLIDGGIKKQNIKIHLQDLGNDLIEHIYCPLKHKWRPLTQCLVERPLCVADQFKIDKFFEMEAHKDIVTVGDVTLQDIRKQLGIGKAIKVQWNIYQSYAQLLWCNLFDSNDDIHIEDVREKLQSIEKKTNRLNRRLDIVLFDNSMPVRGGYLLLVYRYVQNKLYPLEIVTFDERNLPVPDINDTETLTIFEK